MQWEWAAAMTGLRHRSTEEMASCMSRISRRRFSLSSAPVPDRSPPQVGQVDPGSERFSLGPNDHGPHGRVGVQLGHDPRKLLEELQVHGVAGLGPVKDHPSQGAGYLEL